MRATTLMAYRQASTPPWHRPTNPAAAAWCYATRNRPPHSNLAFPLCCQGSESMAHTFARATWVWFCSFAAQSSAARYKCSRLPPQVSVTHTHRRTTSWYSHLAVEGWGRCRTPLRERR